jgi:hypothetical protein
MVDQYSGFSRFKQITQKSSGTSHDALNIVVHREGSNSQSTVAAKSNELPFLVDTINLP